MARLTEDDKREMLDFRCKPENPNLNLLRCKNCLREWYFDPPGGWNKECSSALSHAVHTRLPRALEEIYALEAERAELVKALLPFTLWGNDTPPHYYERAAELLARMEKP